MTFSEQYPKIFNLVKSEIDIVNNKLLEDISLPDGLNTVVKKFLSSPSKKIRIVLPLLYLKMTKTCISDDILSHLSAIEIVHNASLIHDDVIDNDTLRRNSQTINSVYNNKTAVIIGDYLLSKALGKINKLNNNTLIYMYAKTLEKMCKGEANQYINLGKIISKEEYIEKNKQKTASLFETAVAGAILLADNNNYNNAKLFAENFGIAFQIRDDLLNITLKDTSKPALDIKNGIYTAPVILGGSVENICIGIEKTRLLLEYYIDEAKKLLTSFEDNEYKQALISLLELLKND